MTHSIVVEDLEPIVSRFMADYDEPRRKAIRRLKRVVWETSAWSSEGAVTLLKGLRDTEYGLVLVRQ